MNEFEKLVIEVITQNGGYVSGELAPLARVLNPRVVETTCSRAATALAEQGKLVKVGRGVYFLPDAWAKASEHDKAIARLPYGMTHQARCLYVIWRSKEAQLTTAEIRGIVNDLFNVYMNGGNCLTFLCENGMLNRVKKGVYELTGVGRETVETALAADPESTVEDGLPPNGVSASVADATAATSVSA